MTFNGFESRLKSTLKWSAESINGGYESAVK